MAPRMGTRTVKAHTKKKGSVSVRGYEQKYKKNRGPPINKKPKSPRQQQRTYWLMDSQGRFVGRADSSGETSARRFKFSGKDYTGIVVDKLGRIYGRYNSRVGKKVYDREIEKAHPRN